MSRPVVAAQERAPWRAVAVPSEHGGWGLTLEPVLLGLLVAPSWSGLALAVAAFLAFLARTPLKLVAVDGRRGRALERTALARRIATVEVGLLLLLGAAALAAAGPRWLLAVAVAAPLVAVELWFDVRSRGRRLVPELCGAVGIAAVSAAVVFAADASARLAVAIWLVLAARSLGAIPFVRVQIGRLHRGRADVRSGDAAHLVSVLVAATALVVDRRVGAGVVAVIALAAVQTIWLRRPPVPAKVLGLRQMALGLALVAVTAIGVLVA